jgi:methionyl-tRNA formyltransferase
MTNSKNVIIVGGHEQANNMLEHLINLADINVVLCIIRQDDNGKDGIFPSLMARAKKYNIPILQPEKLNAPQVISAANRLNPDIVLSLQNNMIFGDEWLKITRDRLGIVNIHYAPLPKYGGYWPEMWAIWNGETKFAVTMHYVEKGLDTGPIIAQKWFDIEPLENRHSLYKKSTKFCQQMLLENLDRLLLGRVECAAQVKSERSYFSKSLPNDGFLDLNWDAETQSRFLRAISFPGFPGPKIRIGSQTLTILCEDIPYFTSVKITI